MLCVLIATSVLDFGESEKQKSRMLDCRTTPIEAFPLASLADYL
jgi:hypothetical protein